MIQVSKEYVDNPIIAIPGTHFTFGEYISAEDTGFDVVRIGRMVTISGKVRCSVAMSAGQATMILNWKDAGEMFKPHVTVNAASVVLVVGTGEALGHLIVDYSWGVTYGALVNSYANSPIGFSVTYMAAALTALGS
jgi:hypothetical protein